MESRQLGTSELEITPIVLGTWALGGWLWGGTEQTQARSNALAGQVTLTPDDIAFIRDVFEPLELDEPYSPATAKR
jgi:aryl-alcohol dehydrogenase-like predicted oxidoreductase